MKLNGSRQGRQPATILKSLIFIITAILCAPLPGTSQCDSVRGDIDASVPTPTASVSAGQKDGTALQEIREHLKVSGFRSWRDLRGTAQVTTSGTDQPRTYQARVFFSGSDRFRLETDKDSGTEVLTLVSTGGKIKLPDGTKQPLTASEALAGPTSFLKIRDVSLLSDPSTTVIDHGFLMLNQRQQRRVTIAFPAYPGAKTREQAKQLSISDYYIDSQSHTLTAVASCVTSPDSVGESYLQFIQFGNYQDTGGSMIPLSIQFAFGGQLVWSLDIKQLSRDTGVDPHEFRF